MYHLLLLFNAHFFLKYKIKLKGRKYWTISLHADPLSMTGIPIAGLALDLVAVSLSDGSILFYNGANLVHTITTADPISSMIFGRYGQEEHALISISSSKSHSFHY